MSRSAADTKRRVLAAASELFAERGFHATKARDIAERAGVNLAAGHYHYGSKRELYLEVLRAQFEKIRAVFERRGTRRSESEIARLSREELTALFETRLGIMLDFMIGPPPSLHSTLMQREMADPSDAMPVIVREFIQPMVAETEQIVRHLAPDLDAVDVERCVNSIFGQAVFYRFAMPAMLYRMGRKAYARGFAREIAAHIAGFSLGGMERKSRNSPRRRHAG